MVAAYIGDVIREVIDWSLRTGRVRPAVEVREDGAKVDRRDLVKDLFVVWEDVWVIDPVVAPLVASTRGVNEDVHLIAAAGRQELIHQGRRNRVDPVDRSRLVRAINDLWCAVQVGADRAQSHEGIEREPPGDLSCLVRVESDR